MNINLHIERIVFEDISINSLDYVKIEDMIAAQLVELSLTKRAPQDLMPDGSVFRSSSRSISLVHVPEPAELMQVITGGIYGGLEP